MLFKYCYEIADLSLLGEKESIKLFLVLSGSVHNVKYVLNLE